MLRKVLKGVGKSALALLIALGIFVLIVWLAFVRPLSAIFEDKSLTVEQARVVIPKYQEQLRLIALDVLNHGTRYVNFGDSTNPATEFTDDQVFEEAELRKIYRDCKIEAVYERDGVVLFRCPDPPDGIGFSRFHTLFFYSPDDEFQYIPVQGDYGIVYELTENTENSKAYRYVSESDPNKEIGYRIERILPHWFYQYEAAPIRP